MEINTCMYLALSTKQLSNKAISKSSHNVNQLLYFKQKKCTTEGLSSLASIWLPNKPGTKKIWKNYNNSIWRYIIYIPSTIGVLLLQQQCTEVAKKNRNNKKKLEKFILTPGYHV